MITPSNPASCFIYKQNVFAKKLLMGFDSWGFVWLSDSTENNPVFSGLRRAQLLGSKRDYKGGGVRERVGIEKKEKQEHLRVWRQRERERERERMMENVGIRIHKIKTWCVQVSDVEVRSM